ncbi:uncharacterized protein LOC110860067 [Folsomia candida]|uniref:Epididymal secretory protein E1 n=1 Tax=Folsomia candida TaxID=158441 RepID=A0A226D760_FOLCA|nr:uncharacterized protein LOC110860067 [Folsomia candida]OXA41385.1 Epididymal secretory protein E1 [Folsomia candida]
MFFQKLFILAMAIGSLSAASIQSNPSVSLSKNGKESSGVLQLDGVGNCGNGLLIDVRMTGCTQAPCQLNRGQTYNIQVDFLHTGTRDFGNLNFKSLALKDNQIQTITNDVTLHGVRLIPGQIYTFDYDLIVPSTPFGGVESEIRFKVYQNLWKPLCVVIPATLA